MGREVIRQQMRDVAPSTEHPNPGEEFSPAVELANEIALESMEIDRLFRVVASLDQVRQTMSGVNQATMEHLALVESVLYLTNVPGLEGEHIPNLESHLGGTLSQEGLVDRIMEILQMIRRMIASVMDKIRSFFSAASEDSAQLWVRLGLSRDVWKELQGRFPKRPQVQMGATAYLLTGRVHMSHDAKAMLTMGAAQVNQLHVLRTRYVPLTLQAGRQLQEAMGNVALRNGDLTGWLDGLTRSCSMISPENLNTLFAPLERTVDARWADGVARMAPPVLGGRAIFVLDGNRVEPGEGPIERAIAQQQTRMVFERINPGRSTDTSKAVMATMPHNQINIWLEMVESMLKEIDAASAAGIRSTLTQMDRRLEQLIKEIPNKDQGVGLLQTGLSYGSAFTTWVKAPFLNMLAHSLSVSGALITAANKHMAAY